MDTAHINNPARARRWAWRIGLMTLFGTLLLCGYILINTNGDPLTFIWIGTRFAEGDPQGTVGYDGQFAYFIARDGAEAVPYMDGASLRYQRILYPLVSRVLAFGQADWVPWTMLLVNILAHSLGAGLMTYLVTGLGAPPYIGLAYSLWIGALYSVRLGLNESLCFALVLAAIVAYVHGRNRWTILFLILSTMTKELGMIFAAGLMLHAFSQRRFRWGILYSAAPLLTFLIWWGFMRLWFGTFPTRYPAAKFHIIPLYGFFTEESIFELIMLALWLAIPAVILFLAALRIVWRNRTLTLGPALVIPGAGFVLGMPDVSWQDPAAAYRVATSLVITGLIFTAQCCPSRTRWLFAIWTPAVLVFLMLIALLN